MEPTDLTIQILESIRDEIRGTNARLESLERTTATRFESLGGEVRDLRETMDERLGGLERRQTETEVRLATELVAVVGAINDVKTLLRENYASTIRDLDRRVRTIEERLGP